MESFKLRRIAFLFFILSCCSTCFWNELNLSFIKNHTDPEISLYYRETIKNVDSEYYLSQVVNFSRGYGWRWSSWDESKEGNFKKPVGTGSFIRRTPGYSLFYFVFYKIFGFPRCLNVIKIMQILLYALTSSMIFYLSFWFTRKIKVAVILTLLYTFLPLCNTYIYFTLTESISPFLVTSFIFFLFKSLYASGKARMFYGFVASFFIGYAILTRPYVGIIAILLPIFISIEYWRRHKSYLIVLKYLIAGGFVPVLMIGIWTYRNYSVTGEIELLERGAHPNNLDRAKPAFFGFWRLCQSWGEDGSKMNSYQIPFWGAAINGDTSMKHVDVIIKAWPAEYVDELGKNRLKKLLKEYQLLIFSQRQYYLKNIAMPDEYSASELKVAKEFMDMRNIFISNHPFLYYVKTPLIYLNEIIFHSNTSNVYMFSKEFYGNIFLFTTKLVLKVLHVLSYFIILVNLFCIKKIEQKLTFVFVPVLLLFYFSFLVRSIDQRLMLVYLPILFLGICFPLNFIFDRINEWKKCLNV